MAYIVVSRKFFQIVKNTRMLSRLLDTHIASLNSVSTLFPEKWQELANIALGDKAITNLSYYSSIHQKADKAVVKHTSEDIAHKLDETIAMEISFLREPVTEFTKDAIEECVIVITI